MRDRSAKLPSALPTAPPVATRGSPRRIAGVQSFEVGLALLSLLAHQRRPMKITELAAQASMPPAKAHRYLASLVRSGYASQNADTGLYSTGPSALDFSLSCLSTIEPIVIASTEAAALCRATGHTVALAVWGSFGPTVVRWEQPARPVMVNIGPGSVFPLLESATGRVFAAFYDETVIERHLQRLAETASEGEQVAGAVSTRAGETIEQVRKRGMARARGDFMSGLSAFSAPILDYRGALVLSMTVLDYSRGWDHRWEGPIAQALREAALRTSASLGHGATATQASNEQGPPARASRPGTAPVPRTQRTQPTQPIQPTPARAANPRKPRAGV